LAFGPLIPCFPLYSTGLSDEEVVVIRVRGF